MLMPMIGAQRPTVSDVRAPYTSRASSSRPRPSVPSQCERLGLARRSSMSMSSGPCGSSTAAKVETITTKPIQPSASQNRFPVRRVRLTGLTIAVSMPMSSTAMANPRIEHGVTQIDNEIHQHEAAGDEQHHALQDDQVAGVERADQQPADPRQRKNRLHDQGPADQPADIDSGDGDQRQRRGF